MWYRSVEQIAERVRHHELAGDAVCEMEVDDLRALLDVIPRDEDWTELEEAIASARDALKSSSNRAANSARDSLQDALYLLDRIRK